MARQAVNMEIRGRDRTRTAFASASRNIDNLVRSGGRLGGLFRSAGPVGIGIAAIGTALYGVVRVINNTIDRLDELDKAAANAGVDAETLQVWRTFGELVGSTAQQVDTALRRLRRRTGEAIAGGAVAQSFERLGIDLDFLRKNADNAEVIMLRFAQALGDAENRSVAYANAIRIVDIEGARLVQGLIQSAGGVQELEERMRRLGIVVSNQAVAAAAQAKDELTLLNLSVRNNADQIVSAFIPAYGAFATYLTEVVVPKVREFNDLLDIRPNEGVLDRIEDLTDDLIALNSDLRINENRFRAGRRQEEAYRLEADRLQTEIEGVVAELRELNTELDNANRRENVAFDALTEAQQIAELANQREAAQRRQLALESELERRAEERRLQERRTSRLIASLWTGIAPIRAADALSAQADSMAAITAEAQNILDVEERREKVQRERNRLLLEALTAQRESGKLTEKQYQDELLRRGLIEAPEPVPLTSRELAEEGLRSQEAQKAVALERLKIITEAINMARESNQITQAEAAALGDIVKLQKERIELEQVPLPYGAEVYLAHLQAIVDVQRQRRIEANLADYDFGMDNDPEVIERVKVILGLTTDIADENERVVTAQEAQIEAAYALQYAFAGLSDTTEGWLRFLAQGTALLAQFGGFRGFFDAIRGRGGTTGGTTGGTPTGGGAQPPARYRGGPVSAAMPYIVGERGAELFIPKIAGHIIPHNALGGNLTQNVALNVNAPITQAEFNNLLLRSGPLVASLLRDINKRSR